METALIIEIAGLGIAAVDAIGIAFMPILLAQVDGLRRALVFLVGSFISLMLVGLTFTTGPVGRTPRPISWTSSICRWPCCSASVCSW